jgi:hypothetical protein
MSMSDGVAVRPSTFFALVREKGFQALPANHEAPPSFSRTTASIRRAFPYAQPPQQNLDFFVSTASVSYRTA